MHECVHLHTRGTHDKPSCRLHSSAGAKKKEKGKGGGFGENVHMVIIPEIGGHGMRSSTREEEEQVSGEWRRSRYRHSIGFLGHGQLSHPFACSARATSVSLCARPVSLWTQAAAAAARVICASVRSICVCERERATISREQGPNKLSLISTLARGQCCGGHRYQVLRKPRARTRAHSLCLCLSLYASLSPSPAQIRTWKGK